MGEKWGTGQKQGVRRISRNASIYRAYRHPRQIMFTICRGLFVFRLPILLLIIKIIRISYRLFPKLHKIFLRFLKGYIQLFLEPFQYILL